jgi:glycine/D-amino acid oxidase-like deaminating enzyme
MNRVADAIVVGSGALGASTAFYLASHGRAVALVDRPASRCLATYVHDYDEQEVRPGRWSR